MAGNLQKDPVCGMMVDPATAAGQSEYMGKTYYFCAQGCKVEFDQNPAKFAAEPAAVQGAGGKRWWEFWKK